MQPTFATAPSAVVTPMSPAEVDIGLTCGFMTIGQLNWLFQQSLGGGGGVATGSGPPVAAPGTGAPLLYLDTTSPPDTLYFWDGTTWVRLSPAYVEDYAHAEPVEVGVSTRINPLVSSRGATGSSAVFSALTDVTVTLEPDGTHRIMVGPNSCTTGVWSYSYTVTCGGEPCTARVSGVSPSGVLDVAFPIIAPVGSIVGLAITTEDASPVTIVWGDGTLSNVPSGVTANHTYLTAFTGNLIVRHSFCTVLTGFVSGGGGFTGSIANIPQTLLEYSVAAGNTTSGSIASLPAGLLIYNNTGLNTTTGSINSLPAGLLTYNNQGGNTTSGAITALPVGLTTYRNLGTNTTTGTIASLPAGLVIYQNQGSNTTSGSIAALPAALTNYTNLGLNTTTGSISALPAGLLTYWNQGSNTTTGLVQTLPVGLVNYTNQGSNTTSGDIAGLPATLAIYNNIGLNTVSGDIASIQAAMRSFITTGNNTISGDIANIAAGVTVFSVFGANTITGDIATLKTGLTNFGCYGLNTTFGALSGLPASLTAYANRGLNTATGNISDLKPVMRFFQCGGNSVLTAAPATWGGALTLVRTFEYSSTVGLNTAGVDAVLLALSAITSWGNERLVNLAGANATPSAAGQASRTAILANGATLVLVN